MSLRKLGFISPSKTVVLLCDVQEKFRQFEYFAQFSKNVNKVILASKALDIPLIVTEQNPEKLGATVSEFDIKHAVGNFAKTKFSMVVPDVRTYLSKVSNLESIVLVGMESHICIEQTAMDLLSLEKYNVHIVADCVLSRTLDDRAMALKRLENMGCIITTSENLIFKLIQDKDHPKFNIIRKLVAEPSVFPGIPNKL